MKKVRLKKFHWLTLVAGVIGGVGLITGGIIFYRIHTATRPLYTGPVENISTGLIGEYAALILIAQEKGYFTDYGLNVAIKEYPSGPASLEDLLKGKIDTALASGFAGVRNSLQGEDLKIVATVSKSQAFDLVARKDRGINEALDLRGKKIGMTQKTVGEFFLGQFLTFNKINKTDVVIVDLPQAELTDALAAGDIDAAVLFEPNAYQAVQRLGDTAQHWSIQSGQPIYTSLYSTGKLTSERPEAFKRYMQAVVQAEKFTKEHPLEARTLIGKRLHYDQAYMEYMWPKFQFTVSLDQELLLNMDDEARFAIENGLTTATKGPNYLRFIYFDALSAVKPEKITIIR